MIRLRHKLFVYAMRVLDPVILIATLLAVLALTEPGATRPLRQVLWEAYHWQDAVGIAVLVVGWLYVFDAMVHYDTDRFTPLKSELIDVATAIAVSMFLLMAVSTAAQFGRVTNQVIMFAWAIATPLALTSRLVARGFLMAVRRSGYNYRHLLIVGWNAHALKIAERIDRLPELGYKIAGFVSEAPSAQSYVTPAANHPVLGTLSQVQRILEHGSVDEVIVCLPVREHLATIFDVVRMAEELGIVARLFPDETGSKILSRLHLERFAGDHVVTLFREQMVMQLLGKRALDAAVSLLLLVLLSPLLLIVAIAIKLSSPGPVLFVQQRVGMNRRRFSFYKFRSMYADAEARRAQLAHLNEMDGPVFKIANDPRVTPLGRLLRKTSIDELPQLFNVLRGEMSLVGPRPPIPDEVDRYEWLYRRRLSIKPGITCLWQISGRNHVSFDRWMTLDQQYIDNWSLWLDITILARTIPAVLSLRGAS